MTCYWCNLDVVNQTNSLCKKCNQFSVEMRISYDIMFNCTFEITEERVTFFKKVGIVCYTFGDEVFII